jgi:hypothetical protein
MRPMMTKQSPQQVLGSKLDSLPESSGLPWQRDQNQREANAESFLIDTGIGEASICGVAQDL